MQYKYLGKTGIKISAVGLGTMTFGSNTNLEESKTIFNYCVDAGVNLIDTSSSYSDGLAEQQLGKIITSKRDSLILCSKVFFPTNKDINAQGLSKRHIINTVHQSLKNLNTDWIDIYYLHAFDPHTDLTESLVALTLLVQQGKILYLGLSNFAAWQVMKAISLSELKNYAPISCIQPMYNLIKRQAEVELLPLAAAETLGVLTYSPLAGGLLTGKYTKPNSDGRLNHNKRYRDRYWKKDYLSTAEQFTQLCHEHNINPSAAAIAWIKTNPLVTAPLLGFSSAKQAQECLTELKIQLTADFLIKLDALFPAPPHATDR